MNLTDSEIVDLRRSRAEIQDLQRQVRDLLRLFPLMGKWQTWTPNHTGFTTAPVGGVYRFLVVGRLCFYVIREPNTGESSGGGLTISAPLTAATIAGAMWMAPAALSDNGIALTTWGRGRIGSGESVITFGTNPAIDGGFTTGGGKRVAVCQGVYEIPEGI